MSDQFYGNENHHLEIRAKVVAHMQQNRELYQAFVTDEAYPAYVARMGKPGTFATNIEVVACSRVFQCDILVHQLGQSVWRVSTLDSPPHHPVHIVYHAWEHYSSLRNLDGTGGPLKIQSVADGSSTGAVKQDQCAPAATGMESIVLKSLDELTELDLPKIRELLKKYRGNPSAVVDHILEERETQPRAEPPSTVSVPPAPAPDPACAPLAAAPSASKQKKLNRKDQVLANREKRKANKLKNGAAEQPVSAPPLPLPELLEELSYLHI
ncbi:hypothetical protein HDV03_005326 [Kappamyces sp. JEL0829]|nr:hypothetical protein HDV03_005326 [Kappamyces sp. JEL0829]